MPSYTGEQIRMYRKERNLTQKKLGELCGIADSNIRKYETGKQRPKLETLEKIANALGVHWLDLIGDDPYSNEILSDSITSISDKEFSHAWEDLLVMNNIRFMSYTKHTGEHGLLFAIDDDRFRYFLPSEQCEKLPGVAMEQVKTLIKTLADEPFDKH